MIISLTCNYISRDNGEHLHCSAWFPPASAASLPQSESRSCQFSAANSPTVSAPLELICHQFLFHHPNCFWRPRLSQFSPGKTFHYRQKLNTWWPPLSCRLPHEVEASFSLPAGKEGEIYSQFWNCTITGFVMISITANHSASLWRCMLISALMNPISVWFCRQPFDCIDQLTCVVTHQGGGEGRHVLICLSDVHGAEMSSQLQSGEVGWNGRRLAGQHAKVVRLGSTLFLCQTVFWLHPYPHIQPTEPRHGAWHVLKVSHRRGKKKLFFMFLFS